MRRVVILLAAVFALGCQARRPSRPVEVQPVLPAGQESLFREMLGGSEPLPGGCRLAGASVTVRQVTGRYQCAGVPGVVIVELHHPATAPPGSTPAGALSVYARTAEAKPLGLFDLVFGRVQTRASAVRWLHIAAAPARPTAADTVRVVEAGTPRAAGVGSTPRAPHAAPPSQLARLQGGLLSARGVCLLVLVLGVVVEVRRRKRASPR
jgi:hypothetical protein